MRNELSEMTNAIGAPFHLVELPLPDPIYDPEDGTRLPATYANYLIVNGAVLMPAYGQPKKDKLAAMILESAMPEYEIIPSTAAASYDNMAHSIAPPCNCP